MEIIAEYLEYLENERELSFNSLRLYKRDLLDFDSFIKSELSHTNFEITNLDPQLLEKFQKWVFKQGKSPATANRKLTALHGLWKWLLEQGIVQRDPFTQIVRESQFRNKIANCLSEEEINQILDCEEHNLRTKIVLELIYATGIRVGELTALTLADIDLENQLITIPRSNRFPERVIPFNQKLKKHIEDYAGDNILRPEDKMFFSRKGGQVSEREIFRLVRDAARRARVDKKVSPSILRNSFIKHMKDRGAFDVLLKDLTGQKTLTQF